MADNNQSIEHKLSSCPLETLKDVEPGDLDVQSLSREEDKRILRRIDL